jgi:predicted metalloendopeptidase
VNAYYNPVFNEIVFPAAILQPPFFDPNADPAVNYGGIGGVIGHEMGHGFDDQGAKSDARGVLRNWWKDEDTSAFKKLDGSDLARTVRRPTSRCRGSSVNGRFTLGENIGDNGGLQVAYEAYKLSLAASRAGHSTASPATSASSTAGRRCGARSGARGAPAQPGDRGPALAGGVPRQRPGAQHGRLVRRPSA